MREELIRVLNNKLEDINSDIDTLVELNGNITSEEDKLVYVSGILDLFKSNDGNDIMCFNKLSKDDFNKILDILGNDVKDVFSSSSCNYDGLVYLINGINDGVSLILTDEQSNSIKYLIQKLAEKKEEHQAAIEGYNLVKSRYLISDVDILKNKKENYLEILDELDHKHYVSNTNLLLESMQFSDVSDEETINILKYLLEYNAEVYRDGTDLRKEKVEETNQDTLTNKESFNIPEGNEPISSDEKEQTEVSSPEITLPSENKDLNDEYQEFHFNDVVKDDFTNFSPLSLYNNRDDEQDENEINESHDYIPLVEQNDIEIPSIASQSVENKAQDEIENQEEYDIDNDVYDTEYDIADDEKITTSDLHMLLGKYDIQEDNTNINELVVGDIKNYEDVLNTLQDNDLISSFKNNSELLIETLLYSNSDAIEMVLKIIRNDLSVDDEDCVITTKIAINTIPSIFVSRNGNYDNFVNNVKLFKELDLNLINLFDFSKELFVANNDTIVNNLDIVKKYDISITHRNAKYLLLLPNIGDRLDYYVESVYEDKQKKEMFDGIEYINEYTAKLNVVADETIKRLRYCSENGKKVFGNKPKSLTGDITNLKVNSLDITGEYLNKFFNNEFTDLTGDEVREYIKLIHNSSNVGNYDDELDFLEQFHNGLRYVIEGINISYNKVLRNYSILRSYGIDNKKALHFAVCYNLVITKDEYEELKNALDELGGNL